MIRWHPSHLLKAFSILYLIHLFPCFSSNILFDSTNYTFNVSENELPGYIVGHIAATSSDGQQVLFTILSGNNYGTLRINSTTGIITTATILNYENVTEYVLTIEASSGDIVNSSIVSIYVSFEQSIYPHFANRLTL